MNDTGYDVESGALHDLPQVQTGSSKRVFLKLKVSPKYSNEVLKDEPARRRMAEELTHIVSMENTDEHMPYMPQPGDTYRWSIDKFGNDFWVKFNEQDNLQFVISCRYESQAQTLWALATYVSLRLNCEIIGPE